MMRGLARRFIGAVGLAMSARQLTSNVSPGVWVEQEFRTDSPQIVLRYFAEEAPKLRANCAQFSARAQAKNCVNMYYIHTSAEGLLTYSLYSG